MSLICSIWMETHEVCSDPWNGGGGGDDLSKTSEKLSVLKQLARMGARG